MERMDAMAKRGLRQALGLDADETPQSLTQPSVAEAPTAAADSAGRERKTRGPIIHAGDLSVSVGLA